MIITLSLLVFIVLSIAFFLESSLLLYFSGITALILCFAILRDLLSIKEILKNEVEEEVRELPEWLTGLGSSIGKFIEAMHYRKDALEWEISSNDPSIDLSYKDFSSVLASSGSNSFYLEFVNKILNKFRCNACAVILNENEIYLAGDKNLRLSESLNNFFRQYFLSGETNRLGFHDSRYDQSGIGEPASFGYMFSLSEAFVDNASIESKKGIIWLGYDQVPLNCERIWISDLAKKLEGELAAFRAVSALNKQVEEIQEKSSQKTEFISHMSHDIRSPINNIKSILHVLKLEGTNQEHIDLVNVSLANCDSVMEIVEDLLDFTRYQLGELSSKREVFDINKLLVEVVNNYSHSANSKGLKVVFSNNLHELYVSADLRQIRRALSNLIGNAIKYTDKGKVVIDIQHLDSNIVLSIQDSGIGMSEEQLLELFTPFKRFASSKADGIGLGLALSKIIIEENLGKISVTSTLGEGSKFSISLPAVDSAPIYAEPTFIDPQLKIVLVDDNIDFVDSISRGLEALGVEVIKAYSISDAISLTHDCNPDYIVSDKNMPGGGVRALIEQLNPFSNAEVVVITGADDRGDLKFPESHIIKKVLQKPVVASEIFDTLIEVDNGVMEEQAA